MTTTLLNNRYQILESLARGGFGETFLAIDTHMPSARKCVIKQLKPIIESPSLPSWLIERFQREAAILEDLGETHPQIPRLYAYFAENENFYLVQEWIEGLTLTQKHKLQGNFASEEITEILIKILPILDYIHNRRIIHRDVKPDNIIIRASDGLPVLIDFGVMKEAMATLIHPDGVSAYSVALGTPGYMASEQAAGRPVFSSDLYSLGLTAVFLLTGKTPQYLETDPRSGEILWRNVAPDLHSNLALVIDQAIRFHPRDRFCSAQEMLDALKTPFAVQTAATVAVAPGQLKSQKILGRQTPEVNPQPPMILPPLELEEEKKSSFGWLVSLFVIGGLMIGGFLIGFSAFLAQQRSRVAPSPSPTLDSPEPSFSPTPSVQQPEVRPRRRPRIQSTPQQPYIPPQQEANPTPTETIAPSPEAEISPSPTETPTPTPEGQTPTPPAETPTPTPEGQTPTLPTETVAPTPEGQTPPSPTVTPPVSQPTPLSPPPSPTPTQPSPQPSASSPSEQDKSLFPQSRGLKIPIVPTGSKEELVRQNLGQPTTVNKGLWGNSRAVLYKNVVPNKVDVGYLFNPQTGRIRQTEVSFAQSVGLTMMKTTLNQLLSGKAPSSVKHALEQVYQRQSSQYSFLVGNLKGTIQRNQFDRIYIGIWEADFH